MNSLNIFLCVMSIFLVQILIKSEDGQGKLSDNDLDNFNFSNDVDKDLALSTVKTLKLEKTATVQNKAIKKAEKQEDLSVTEEPEVTQEQEQQKKSTIETKVTKKPNEDQSDSTKEPEVSKQTNKPVVTKKPDKPSKVTVDDEYDGTEKTTKCPLLYTDPTESELTTPYVYRFGDYCEHDEDCQQDIEGKVACMNHKCLCLRGHNYNSIVNACYMSTKIGEFCTDDDDCLSVEFAYCKKGAVGEKNQCTCNAGRASNAARTSCDKNSPLNGDCDVDRDCRVQNAVCEYDTCQCGHNSTMTVDGNYCVIVDGTTVDSPCTNSAQCIMKFAACLNLRCTCILGTIPNNDFTACHKVYKLYTECKTNVDCNMDNSFCDHKRCACMTGYSATTDGLHCIEKRIRLRDRCSHDSNCIDKHAKCVSGFCECEQGFHETKRQCTKERIFGEICNTTEECFYVDSVCSDNVCCCKEDMDFINGKCDRMYPVLFSTCDEEHPCMLDEQLANCTDHKCLCANETTYAAEGYRECLPKASPYPLLGHNASCEVHSHCRLDNSVCRNYECQCKFSHYINKQRNGCLPKQTNVALLVTPCSEDNPCTIRGSECIKNKCLCSLNSIMSDDLVKCTPLTNPKIGDACSQTTGCFIEHTTCVNETCQCEYHYEKVNNTCEEQVGYLGYSCTVESECLVEHSVCYSKKICACQVGPMQDEYAVTPDGDMCIMLESNGSKTHTGIPCEKHADCMVNNDVYHECIDNFCVYSVDVPKILQVVTVLDAKCRFHDECNIENALCVDNRCTCSNGTANSYDKKRCLPFAEKINDPCEEDNQCNMEYVTCRQGTCQCEPGYGVDSADDSICRQLNGIGFNCTHDIDCEVANTTCAPNSKCACMDGYSAYKLECFEDSFTMLSPCDIDFQCQKNLGPNSNCLKHLCHCNRGFNFDTLRNYCSKPNLKQLVAENKGNPIYHLHLMTIIGSLLLGQIMMASIV